MRAREAVISARLSAFAIAVAKSSVNCARRVSVSAGSRGSNRIEPTVITPHRRPSTTIGVPTVERKPLLRAAIPTGPEASSKPSTRPGRPDSWTIVTRFLPSIRDRLPTGKRSTGAPQVATQVTVPSAS